MDLLSFARDLSWHELLLGSWSVIATWLRYRQRRYSRELSVRQQQQSMRLVNEIWKTAFETVLREQPRRLRDLVEDTESESSLKP